MPIKQKVFHLFNAKKTTQITEIKTQVKSKRKNNAYKKTILTFIKRRFN